MLSERQANVISLLIFATLALLVPAAVILRHFLAIDPFALLHIAWGRSVVGLVFALLATAVTGLNFYLAILSPWLYRRQHGSLDDYGHISGLPLIGNIFVLIAGALLPSSAPTGVFLLALWLLDSGGLPWFFFAMLRERN